MDGRGKSERVECNGMANNSNLANCKIASRAL